MIIPCQLFFFLQENIRWDPHLNCLCKMLLSRCHTCFQNYLCKVLLIRSHTCFQNCLCKLLLFRSHTCFQNCLCKMLLIRSHTCFQNCLCKMLLIRSHTCFYGELLKINYPCYYLEHCPISKTDIVKYDLHLFHTTEYVACNTVGSSAVCHILDKSETSLF